jgi:DNA-binding IclR family transcriptional regulator
VHHVFRPDDSLQTLDTGTLLPVHATALGKVLVAYDSGVAAEVVGAVLEQYTRRTLVTPAALRKAITEVREQGWAYEAEEYTSGQASIAAPIRGYGGYVVGAISIAGSVDRLCPAAGRPEPSLVTFVQNAARAISRDLGAGRW